ncbi:aminopeptidase N [Enteractinococcus fodinae]|uniref:Aminopeptidase N n=1 Tax=Enteractinococcus fodinae TaxID=684663 RepID=A0ABU2B0L5_9MICC|nr:aminopeptidase N [Enteractinococcus fodinae]MDR7347143.1 aminopeptidase N [Enteractinococcus fodinae]
MSNHVPLDNIHLNRDEAFARAELISIDSYEIELDLSNAAELDEPSYPVTTTISFRAATSGTDTFLNYLGQSVEAVTLNGTALDVAEVVGSARIALPNLAHQNQVVVRSHSLYSRSGEGLHRFVDPVDGQVYLYSQFEPADARRVYPNMEQPDLKAAFTIRVVGDEAWTLASNGAETHREHVANGLVRVHFEPTKPISTYLTTFLAGPYAHFTDTWVGHVDSGAQPIELRIFARQSLAEHVDAPELFALTKQGLTWFHDQFQHAYPWGKYDQAFVPEYNLGAMENPGLVTFNETYIFTSRATVSQHMQRATTVMHEMSHMWFGNLVTMKWWDDLWLKESFADFYGTKAVAEATDIPGAWQSFAHQRKGWAYVQDAYPTTHPIVADIVDLEAARQNFDGITYAKGAAVIKQLFRYVGEQAFIQACRIYFNNYAYGTAQLEDFLAVLEHTSGLAMREWAQAWLQTAGAPTLQATVDSTGSLTVTQTALDPITGAEVLRPHALSLAVLTLNAQQQLANISESPVVLQTGQRSVSLTSKRVPREAVRAVIINSQDDTYAQVVFDEQTLHAVTNYPVSDSSSTTVATIWSTLWTMVRQASFPAAEFVRAVATLSPTINEVSMHARILEQAVVALQDFAPEAQRDQLTKHLATALSDSFGLFEPGSDRQRSAAKAFAQLGRGTGFLATELNHLLADNASSDIAPGLEVDDELKWLFLTSLASLGHIDSKRLDDELATSRTAINELRHRTATAAVPDPVRQAQLWRQVFDGTDATGKALSNAELSAIATGLRASAPRDQGQHLETLLAGLTWIWDSRSNNLATRTIDGLFPIRHSPIQGGPETQREHPVLHTIDAWLADHPEAPSALRRLVIERRTDVLDRLRAQAAADRSPTVRDESNPGL